MQVVKLQPGQFIFGRVSASKELKMSERTIRTCLDKLKNMKNVTIKTTNRYSIISIVNWDIYQPNRPTDDQQNDQPATSRRPADDHKQEGKEGKEGKDINLLSDSNESDHRENFDRDIYEFVVSFQNAVFKSLGSRAPKITPSLLKNGSSTLDKLIRIDGFNKQDVFNSIRWAYKDSFWSTQVFSLASLRSKGKNGLTKFQNIVNSMQTKTKSITGSSRTDQNIRAAMEFITNER